MKLPRKEAGWSDAHMLSEKGWGYVMGVWYWGEIPNRTGEWLVLSKTNFGGFNTSVMRSYGGLSTEFPHKGHSKPTERNLPA